MVGRRAMRGLVVLDEPLAVGIEALMPIPESWSKAKRALAIEGDLLPASGIDNDNIIKIAQDSLNKIVWRDDALIVSWSGIKLYSLQPMLTVRVWRFENRGTLL